MRARDRLVIEAFYASWADRDLDATLACLSDDIVFRMHLPQEVAPFAGETHGKAAIVPRLEMILDEFDFLEYRLRFIRDKGEELRSQVRYRYRHKNTGYVIEGTMRHVWRIEGDQIVCLDEYHDTPRIRAFFQLLEQAMSGATQREFPNIKRNR